MTTILIAERRPTTDALLATAAAEVLVLTSRVFVPRAADYRNLRRGVRYRVLAPAFTTQLRKLALAGAEVRTVPAISTDAVVIDRTTAVYPAEHGAAPFRLLGVVTTAVEHFQRLWATAIPAQSEFGDRERELLSLLAAGHTDAAAAEELGVSVRTVRRSVADLMNRLGARSRFMAGAKAAHHGWLSESGSTEPAGRKVA
ncbi:LuxR C-terminal-related transcriptional regulator [Amycolatopsis sp. GM8]|uniref:LuxR C-terminal-related transcriptional regulator n=1 Tax=Amycolatopsis sp. GM8 TaxID=2896530 RepID=UPI001EFF8AD9|nr:LuxR C-terminal-related transcriptional regulator [Amycolatopsis sp. GM8]